MEPSRRWELSDGVVMRSLERADAGAMHRLIAENRAHLDQWLRWSAGLQTREDVEAFIAGFEEKSAGSDGFHMGIWCDGALAGGLVCWYVNAIHQNAEIGYWLGADFVGRGLATRAASRALDHLFDDRKLNRVEMQCGVENRPSRAIAERLGFELEGIRRQSHWITSRFVDHTIYGLLAPEWMMRRAR